METKPSFNIGKFWLIPLIFIGGLVVVMFGFSDYLFNSQLENCNNMIESQKIIVFDNTNPETLESSWEFFNYYWDLEHYQCDQFYDKEQIIREIESQSKRD